MIKSLTIIFPIFNEEIRLKKSLNDVKKFVDANHDLNLEIIFVDDGSSDNSKLIIQKFIKENENNIYKFFEETVNYGKGYALKIGVNHATNDWVLTSDIDLSVPLDQINIWLKKEKIENNKVKVFFGSREVDNSIVEKKLYRYLLGSIFNIFIKILFKFNIKDTQCGFKLFNAAIAKELFFKQTLDGFGFDFEILFLAQKKKYNIREVPINWKVSKNSKVKPIHYFITLFELFKVLVNDYKNKYNF